MPLLRAVFFAILVCGVTGAGAQEYIRQQTKEQCDSRGGRITQWTNTAGTFPEVGTCFVPPRSPASDRDQPSKSCANYDKAFKQFEALKVPDQVTASQQCSHYGRSAQALERALTFLPCDDYADSYPNKLRQSIAHFRDLEAKWCAKAKAEAAPAPQNNLTEQMKTLFNFDESPQEENRPLRRPIRRRDPQMKIP